MDRLSSLFACVLIGGLVVGSASAGDLAILQFSSDHVVFASTPAGTARLPLTVGSISKKVVSGSLGYVNATSGEYLFGAGVDGVIVQKLGMNRVSNISLADRIGTFTMSGDVYVVSLGDRKLHITKLPRRPSTVRLSDGLALVEMAGDWVLYAPGRDSQHVATLSHRPSSIQMAKDVMITTSSQGTFVFTVSEAGVQGTKVSDRNPTSVVIRKATEGGSPAQAE